MSYEVRIRDWSSDVCSADLVTAGWRAGSGEPDAGARLEKESTRYREFVSHPGALDLSGALPAQGRHKSIAVGHRLDPLLRPDSLAFVGASVRPDTPGNTMVRAVAMDGYAGSVYAINPK